MVGAAGIEPATICSQSRYATAALRPEVSDYRTRQRGSVARGARRRSRMLWPILADYADWALLAMRLLVALVFFQSGWSHVTKTAERAKSIGLSPTFTRLLGIAEIAGALGVAFGVLIQAAALGLILVMLGAIQKKIFVWK